MQKERPLAGLPTLPPAQHQHFLERAREITQFGIEHGGDCFKDWPIKIVFAYAFFQLVDRCCFTIRSNGRLAGVMFAYAMPALDIVNQAWRKEPVFDWQRSEDSADAIFIAEVIGGGKTLNKLFKLAVSRFPNWERKRLYTYRAKADGTKALHPLDHDTIKRLIYGR